MDLSQTPADRLKRARQQRGLSKKQVCEAMPCGRPTLWRWEEGRSTMTVADFAKLATLYGVSMDDLWYGVDSRPRALSAPTGQEDQQP